MTEQIKQAINRLLELASEQDTPKNIKNKISELIKNLQKEEETSIKISRALSKLEEIGEDSNLASFTRMELFNISSMLESQ